MLIKENVDLILQMPHITKINRKIRSSRKGAIRKKWELIATFKT